MIKTQFNTKQKPLFFSDIIGSVENDQKDCVGLPGGMIFEMYCVFEGIRRFNESTGKIGNYNIEDAFMAPLCRLLGEWFVQSEWTFEITYNPEVEEKLKAIMPEVDVKNFATFSALSNPDLDPLKKQSFINTLGDEICFAVLLFLKQKNMVKMFSKNLYRQDDEVVEDKKANTKSKVENQEKKEEEKLHHTLSQGSAKKPFVRETFEAEAEDGSYLINETAMNTICRGLASVFLTEDHEKYSRYMKLTKARSTQLTLDALPPLCIISPEPEEDDVRKSSEPDVVEDSYELMRTARFPKAIEDPMNKQDELL